MRVGMLLVASVVLMTVDHREKHLETIRAGLSVLLSPLQYVANLPRDITDWTNEALAARSHLLQENRRLRAEQLTLKARLLRFASMESENARLRQLLHSSRKVTERTLIGELLAVDFDPFKRQALVNKGSSDGVYDGHPLLDAHGVVGQVIHVAPNTSTIMLITDPSHAIPVQINRNGLRAIALGTGAADELEIPNIPNNADVKVGDLLVTSGLGQRFPRGYPVARIASFEKDPTQAYARIVATPTAALEGIREVLLVWPAESEGAQSAKSNDESQDRPEESGKENRQVVDKSEGTGQ